MSVDKNADEAVWSEIIKRLNEVIDIRLKDKQPLPAGVNKSMLELPDFKHLPNSKDLDVHLTSTLPECKVPISMKDKQILREIVQKYSQGGVANEGLTKEFVEQLLKSQLDEFKKSLELVRDVQVSDVDAAAQDSMLEACNLHIKAIDFKSDVNQTVEPCNWIDQQNEDSSENVDICRAYLLKHVGRIPVNLTLDYYNNQKQLLTYHILKLLNMKGTTDFAFAEKVYVNTKLAEKGLRIILELKHPKIPISPKHVRQAIAQLLLSSIKSEFAPCVFLTNLVDYFQLFYIQDQSIITLMLPSPADFFFALSEIVNNCAESGRLNEENTSSDKKRKEAWDKLGPNKRMKLDPPDKKKYVLPEDDEEEQEPWQRGGPRFVRATMQQMGLDLGYFS
jgi:hypothetical protein